MSPIIRNVQIENNQRLVNRLEKTVSVNRRQIPKLRNGRLFTCQHF